MGTSRWIRRVALGLVAATATAFVGTACGPPPLPVARVGDVAFEEVNPSAFVVTLSFAAPGAVTLRYATADGTATAPADYTYTSGTLTFSAGQTRKTVFVPVQYNSLDEDDETFFLLLSAPSGATIGDGSGTATVWDAVRDRPPTVGFTGERWVVEGNGGPSGGGTRWWTIYLSEPSGRRVTVRFATSDGYFDQLPPATAPADYASASTYVTFPSGTTSISVGVPIVGDTLDEPNEVFTATLSDPTNAILQSGSGSTDAGVIQDDDAPPSVIVSDAAVPERVGSLSFRVRLSAPSGLHTSVAYTTRGGTAEEGEDYEARSGTLRWTPGTTTEWTVSVPVTQDSCREANESLFLDLGSAEHLTLSDPSGQGTISDDDLFPC